MLFLKWTNSSQRMPISKLIHTFNLWALSGLESRPQASKARLASVLMVSSSPLGWTVGPTGITSWGLPLPYLPIPCLVTGWGGCQWGKGRCPGTHGAPQACLQASWPCVPHTAPSSGPCIGLRVLDCSPNSCGAMEPWDLRGLPGGAPCCPGLCLHTVLHRRGPACLSHVWAHTHRTDPASGTHSHLDPPAPGPSVCLPGDRPAWAQPFLAPPPPCPTEGHGRAGVDARSLVTERTHGLWGTG